MLEETRKAWDQISAGERRMRQDLRAAEARAGRLEDERDALREGGEAALGKLRIGYEDDAFTILTRLTKGLDWRTGQPLEDDQPDG